MSETIHPKQKKYYRRINRCRIPIHGRIIHWTVHGYTIDDIISIQSEENQWKNGNNPQCPRPGNTLSNSIHRRSCRYKITERLSSLERTIQLGKSRYRRLLEYTMQKTKWLPDHSLFGSGILRHITLLRRIQNLWSIRSHCLICVD